MTDRRIEALPLNAIKPARRNYKDHSIDEIIRSITRFGFVDAVIIDERTGRLVSGHGRAQALIMMKKAGNEPPEGVNVVDGDWCIPVQRGWSSKNDVEAEAVLVAANRLVETGGVLMPELEAILKDLASANALDGIGYDADEVDRILAEAAARDFSPKEDEDTVPDSAPARSKLGEVWLLGRHRIMCGDSTDAASVAKLLRGAKPHLMVTDPPYGVEYDPKWRNDVEQAGGKAPGGRALGEVMNDDRADWTDAWRLFTGDVAYVWHASTKTHIVAQSLIAAGFELRALIVWAKNNHAMSRGHYHHQHEPCWYAVKKGGTGHWAGDRSQTTLWSIDKPQKSETGHSTQKPVECMRRPMINNSQAGDLVYEPFSGSGTTIIAGEETGRTVYAMELNPAYVDIAVTRWEQFTGQQAELEVAP